MNKRAKFVEVSKEQQDRIDLIRSSFSNMYDVLDINCKGSRETSLALTKLEKAQFWAIKGITREHKEEKRIMNFGKAIELLKEGKRVQRQGWNGKNQYIELAERVAYINAKGEIINEGHSDIGNKVIAFVGTSGVQLGWLASQADMLAEDWKIVEE